MSDVVPAVNGTIIVTGRAGQACAMTAWCASPKVSATTAVKHCSSRNPVRMVVPPEKTSVYVGIKLKLPTIGNSGLLRSARNDGSDPLLRGANGVRPEVAGR